LADADAAGNGSIMRLAPVPMFYAADMAQAVQYAIESSRTTHAAQECLDACHLLAEILVRALSGQDKRAVLLNTNATDLKSPALQAIASGSYLNKTGRHIRGSGYVVRSLEAALWCFWTTETFEQAILKAANLGDDADTTAAICGQVAGAFYGEVGIPARWVQRLKMGKEIRSLALGLMREA
jgi:ADP-ribosyl-[dinitrogen reductase] hydrolase